MLNREPNDLNRTYQSNQPAFRLLYSPSAILNSPEADLSHSFMFKYSSEQRTTLLRLLGHMAADKDIPITLRDAAEISHLVRRHPKLQERKE